jgi:hypothetical protein
MVGELACLGVATCRVNAFAWVAVFSALYDAVTTHLERDSLPIRIGVHETAGIHMPAS